MKRLWFTLRVDWRVQYRSGLMAVSAAFTLLVLIGLRWKVNSADPSEVATGAAAALFAQFFLLASYQIAREKTEGTLALIRVTPLRPHEYLASKVGAWSALAMMQSVVIGIGLLGVGPALVLFLVGMVQLLPFAVLAAFVVATVFERGARLVGACAGALCLSSLPWLLNGSPVAQGWMALHPLQSGLTWMRLGNEAHSLGSGLLALGIEGFWLVIALLVCKKTLARVGNT